LKVQLERLPQPDVGIAVVDCPQALLNLFPGAQAEPSAPFSVLMVDGEVPPDGEVMLDPGRLTMVVAGRPGYALLVSRTQAAPQWAAPEAASAASIAASLALEPQALKLPSTATPAAGDHEFLAEAEAKVADSDLREGLGFLVGRIRDLQPSGFLCPRDQRFGAGRRYVNFPDRFVGFTLHAPNRPVTVHVRRTRVARQSGFRLASERGPYVRFRLHDADDAMAALPLIEASWSRNTH
jgi:hypothetical protein